MYVYLYIYIAMKIKKYIYKYTYIYVYIYIYKCMYIYSSTVAFLSQAFCSTAKLRFFIFWLSAPPVKQACVKA